MRKKKPAQQPEPEWTPGPRIKAFLAVYRKTASITRAAEAAGIRREAHYRHLERSAEYRAAFDAATAIAADALEEEAIRRAYEGVRRPKFYHGKLITVPKNPNDPECKEWVPFIEHEYSDQLLIALLRAKKPREYRERVEVEDGPERAKRFEGTLEELLALYRDLIETPEGEK